MDIKYTYKWYLNLYIFTNAIHKWCLDQAYK